MSSAPKKTLPDDVNATPEWPPAIMAAFTAALAFVLPKDTPILEISSRKTEIRSGLAQRGFSVVVSDMPAHSKSKKPPMMAMQPATYGGVYTIETAWLTSVPQSVMEAYRNVLMPDGVFIYGTGDEMATDIANHMEVGWETILKRNRLELTRRAEIRPSAKVAEALNNMGGTEESFPVARWSEAYSARNRLDWTKERKPPSNISAEIFSRCLKDYERWLKAQFGDLDAPLELVRECAVHMWRFR